MAKKTKKNNSKLLSSPFTKNILMILGILVIGYFAVSIFLKSITRNSNVYILPDFSGMTIDQAQELAEKGHFRLEVSDSVYIRGMQRGVICRQNPHAGSKVKKNRRILLSINSVVPRQVTVPNVVNYSLRQAKTELIASGLQLGRITYIEDIATNNVLFQQYKGKDIEPGTLVESDSKIDLVLGLNYAANDSTYVPNVIGYKYNVAKDFVFDNSLNIRDMIFDNTVSTYTDSLEAFVYSQYPAPSDSISVAMGSEVSLYLSLDESKIPVVTPEEVTEDEE